MPHDKAGKFHLGSQRAHAADKAAAPAAPHGGGAPHEPGMDGGEAASTTLHDHGDGSFHTEGHDGEHVEHPDMQSAMSHIAGKHGGGMGGTCPCCGKPMDDGGMGASDGAY